MKNFILITLLLTYATYCSAQELKSLYSPFYEVPNPSNGELMKVQKPIYLVYNENRCHYKDPNHGWVSFDVLGYKKSPTKTGFEETFKNDASGAVTPGFYWFTITHDSYGVAYQVALPNGTTYLVQKAQTFNENAKQVNATGVNWAAEKADMVKQDSLSKVKAAENKQKLAAKKTQDSISLARGIATQKTKDSLEQVKKDNEEEEKLNSSDNEYTSDIKWLADTINSKAHVAQNCNGKFKVYIDKDGGIVYLMKVQGTCSDADAHVINDAVKGQKVTPLVLKGQSRPCHATIDLALAPSKATQEKEKVKSKLKNPFGNVIK